MNGQYIRGMDNSELTKRALKYMDKYNLSEYSQEKIEEFLDLNKNLYEANGEVKQAEEEKRFSIKKLNINKILT